MGSEMCIRDRDEFYANLKLRLEENHNFPENYIFKFVLPNDQLKLIELLRVFDGLKYTMSSRESKNAKYISITLDAFVLDADDVIRRYKSAGEISGIMML